MAPGRQRASPVSLRSAAAQRWRDGLPSAAPHSCCHYPSTGTLTITSTEATAGVTLAFEGGATFTSVGIGTESITQGSSGGGSDDGGTGTGSTGTRGTGTGTHH